MIEKVGRLWRRATSFSGKTRPRIEEKGREAVWTRISKDRESWRTLEEGYFLQWKDTV